jgi:hypothetical protein
MTVKYLEINKQYGCKNPLKTKIMMHDFRGQYSKVAEAKRIADWKKLEDDENGINQKGGTGFKMSNEKRKKARKNRK